MTRMHKVKITCRATGYRGTFYVRDAGGDEFREIATIRERIFAIEGDYPIAEWTGSGARVIEIGATR